MRDMLDKAIAMARIVSEDKELFAQAKWVAQQTLRFCKSTFDGVSKGVLVLGILMILKSLVETDFSGKKH